MPKLKIYIEQRKDPNCQKFLGPILQAIKSCPLIDARPWRGQCSGWCCVDPIDKDTDAIILWNAKHPFYEPVNEYLRLNKIPKIVVELGWYPQLDTVQIDTSGKGFNTDLDWWKEPLTQKRIPFGNTEEFSKPILALLQWSEDTQIHQRSPHFKSVAQWLQFLGDHSSRPVKVRAHPRHEPTKTERYLVNNHENLSWDEEKNLWFSVENVAGVATINSSAIVEILTKSLYRMNIPILCYGDAVYRAPGAVHCMDNDGERTQEITKYLSTGLYVDAVQELVNRINGRQKGINDINYSARWESFIAEAMESQYKK